MGKQAAGDYHRAETVTEHEILRRALGLCEDLLEICEEAELDTGLAAERLAALEIDFAAREPANERNKE